MKKLIAAIAVIAAGMQLSAFADGEILYWQIDSSKVTDGSYSYAELYYSMDGGISGSSRDEEGWTYVKSLNAGSEIGAALASGMTDSSASFFVEYFNDLNEKIGYSDAVAFSALASSGYVGNLHTQPIVPRTGAWTPGFRAVPEPTSGLLMLIGLAGLALRRKRA